MLSAALLFCKVTYRAVTPGRSVPVFRITQGWLIETAAKALFILVNETEPRCGLKHPPVIIQACLLAHPQLLACANQLFPRQRLGTFLEMQVLCAGLLPTGCMDAMALFWGAEGRKRVWLRRPLEVRGSLLNATRQTLPQSQIKLRELLGSTNLSALQQTLGRGWP